MPRPSRQAINRQRQINQRVQQDFRTPGKPTAFSAISNVARSHNISREKAQEQLEHIDSYVLHKETKRPKQFNPYYVYKKRELMQADLIDIQKLSNFNNNVKYILLIIDVFSRKIFVYTLKSKRAQEMIQKLTQFLRDVGRPYPAAIMTDAGMEFWARAVRNLLNSRNIELRLASGTSKACYAERANKTLQILIYKYLSDRETAKYVDVLEDLVKSYNSRGHRSLEYLSPNDADKPQNQQQVLAIARRRVDKIKREKPKLKLGDMVRIKTDAKGVDPARRAYAEHFHGEYFVITRINRVLPVPMYYLRSMNTGEHIDGGFYYNELSRVRGDVFKIEKVIKRRGRGRNKQVFVKWKYFNDTWNEWIPENQIVETFN